MEREGGLCSYADLWVGVRAEGKERRPFYPWALEGRRRGGETKVKKGEEITEGRRGLPPRALVKGDGGCPGSRSVWRGNL